MTVLSFIHHSQKQETAQMPSVGEWLNCGASRPGNTTKQYKGTHYWYMQQPG